jgi:hypothetical protein
MESSFITIKWADCLDYSLYKNIYMTKSEKIQEITNQILELKKLGNRLDTKHTIQKLQQELGKLIKDEA